MSGLHIVTLCCALIGTAGCRATFVDDRPPGEPDLGAIDLAALDLSGADLTPAVEAQVIARGTFGGRDGHFGAGPAELMRMSDGSVQLRFGDTFEVSGVPGPVVVLASRDDLGTTIDAAAGDLALGTLTSAKGAQSYAVPAGGDAGRRVAFVFCKPFGVEVARALLSDL